MKVSKSVIASAAHHVAEHRLAACATAAGVAVRTGTGWLAIRTGVNSNDLNGVVSEKSVKITPQLVHDLIAWFGSAPASWLARHPTADLTRTLLEAGARAETSGHWSGRLITTTPPNPPDGVKVIQVRSTDDLDKWLGVAGDCGWISNDQDRRSRRELYQALGGGSELRHWLALDGHEPVGFASAYTCGHVLDLCNLGVLAARRRQGIGRALVAARLAAAAQHNVTLVVSAPSPEGWRLQRTLGFQSVPVIPNRCFYLPTTSA